MAWNKGTTKAMFPERRDVRQMSIPGVDATKVVARVFDMECRLNQSLIEKCFQNEFNSIQEESIQKKIKNKFVDVKDYAIRVYGTEGFMPLVFHEPVCIAVGAAMGDGSLKGPMCMIPEGVERGTPEYTDALVKMWWKQCKTWKEQIVSFNGRGYDLPILEMHAMRLNIPLGFYFEDSKKSYRHRYGRHIDLMDQFSNYGAVRKVGKLDYIMKLMGLDGKTGTSGYMVDDLWNAGEYTRVEEYCMGDVTDTHGVFERWRTVTSDG